MEGVSYRSADKQSVLDSEGDFTVSQQEPAPTVYTMRDSYVTLRATQDATKQLPTTTARARARHPNTISPLECVTIRCWNPRRVSLCSLPIPRPDNHALPVGVYAPNYWRSLCRNRRCSRHWQLPGDGQAQATDFGRRLVSHLGLEGCTSQETKEIEQWIMISCKDPTKSKEKSSTSATVWLFRYIYQPASDSLKLYYVPL